jgi:hypothetical protein
MFNAEGLQPSVACPQHNPQVNTARTKNAGFMNPPSRQVRATNG